MEVVAHYLNENATRHGGVEQGVVTTSALLAYRERGMSPTLQPKPWLDCSSVSGWFYMNHNPHNDPHSLVKDAPTVIHTLIDVVSKNGNLFMNFPQRGNGSLYPECETVLTKWRNGCPSTAKPSSTPAHGPPTAKALHRLMTNI